MKKSPGEVNDPINPAHYKTGSIECIDALEAMMSKMGFSEFLKGQVVKYLWRGAHKENELQDAKKALWYLDRLIKHLEKHGG